MSNIQEITIPRPDTDYDTSKSPIPGPTEDSFTTTFGKLLPCAQYLQTSNGKVAYYTYPPNQSTTTNNSPNRVLFLHGVQTPALGLQPLASCLHTSFPAAEFVLLDLYGHGLSSTPLIPHTPSIFHHLIDEVLNHLNWPSCNLLGYSFGGATATSYISSNQQRKDRIESISLIAPAGLWKPASLDMDKFSSADFSTAKTYILELLEGGALIVPTDWQDKINKGEIVAEKIREWQMENHTGHTASVISIVRDGGVLATPEIYIKAVGTGIPIFAVLGETDDVVFEADLKDVGVRDVLVVKGAGHGVVREKVSEVAGFIEGFWRGLEKE